jgi:hypothetical protein
VSFDHRFAVIQMRHDVFRSEGFSVRSIHEVLMVGLLTGFGLCVVAGCGSDAAPGYVSQLVPVSGVVKVDGVPAAGVDVAFVPDQRLPGKSENAGGNATAVTDAEGKYTLYTPPGGGIAAENAELMKGAVPGKYAATFHLWVLPDGSPWALSGNSTMGPALMGAVEKLPAAYGNPLASMNVVDVKAGSDNVFNFDLKTKK